MTHIDAFFNADTTDIQDDMQVYLMTKLGSLFYNRAAGNGVLLRENEPLGFAESTIIKYEIALCLARRNNVVPRRLQALVSQNTISIARKGSQLDIDIQYRAVDSITLDNVSLSINISGFM
ncbi:MAG: hypothetical protein LBP19_05360 [Treponema sp.]|jgi:hypothetical protein|nr:hypothetical protein [Treponema sp.]